MEIITSLVHFIYKKKNNSKNEVDIQITKNNTANKINKVNMTFQTDGQSINILIYLMLLHFLKSITDDFIDGIHHQTIPIENNLIFHVTYHGTMDLLLDNIQIKQFVNC